MVCLLLENSVDVNGLGDSRRKTDTTPHLEVEQPLGATMVRLLLRNGADIAAENQSG